VNLADEIGCMVFAFDRGDSRQDYVRRIARRVGQLEKAARAWKALARKLRQERDWAFDHARTGIQACVDDENRLRDALREIVDFCSSDFSEADDVTYRTLCDIRRTALHVLLEAERERKK
jgi:hypothetical protein